MLKSRAGLNENDFIALMLDRKILIPIWILSMMEPVITFKKSKQ
jgi:hypothetical protein